MRVFDDDRIETSPGVEDHDPPHERRGLHPGLAWLGIGFAIVLAAFAFIRSDDQPDTLTPEQISSTISSEVANGLADAQNVPPAGEIAYATIQPSMVYIAGHRPGTAPDEVMSGAGVIIEANGQILTARHVVAGAESIEVTFVDGTTSSATVVSEQPENDIAVLAAETLPSVVVPAVLGGGVRTGDEVYATGHPFGLANSFSSGVVSALNRTVPINDQQTLTGLIQFDAAVNPGNSGGPLLNRAGQVVGIVTALANPAGENFFVGIGFAVPIAIAGGAAGAPQQ